MSHTGRKYGPYRKREEEEDRRIKNVLEFLEFQEFRDSTIELESSRAFLIAI